jgi:hypothetical protein
VPKFKEDSKSFVGKNENVKIHHKDSTTSHNGFTDDLGTVATTLHAQSQTSFNYAHNFQAGECHGQADHVKKQYY